MKTNDQIFSELVQFISEETGTKANKITREKRIEEDLRIGGDDTLDLLRKFCKNFNVEENIIFEEYASPEGFTLFDFLSIYYKIRGIKVIQKCKSLTVGDMENAIIHKKFIC